MRNVTLLSDQNKILSPLEQEVLLTLFPKGLISLDLETTGLSPWTDRILEIGAIKINSDGEISVFEQLIDPQIPIPAIAQSISQIDEQMIKGAPKIKEVLPNLLQFFDDLPIVAHNARFDLGFLFKDITHQNLPIPRSEIYDSFLLAKEAFYSKELRSRLTNFKLISLAQFFQISIHGHHRAFDDALACLKIFSRCLVLVKEQKRLDRLKERIILFNLQELTHLPPWELPEHLQILMEKIPQQEIIEIKYKGGSHKNLFRPIKPIGLLPSPHGHTLHAFCLLENLPKTFFIHKIEAARTPENDHQRVVHKKSSPTPPIDSPAQISEPLKKKSPMKKTLYWFEFFWILVAHLLMLKWILYTLYESGTWETQKVMLHFTGIALYGAFLIRLCAYLGKKRYLKEIQTEANK